MVTELMLLLDLKLQLNLEVSHFQESFMMRYAESLT